MIKVIAHRGASGYEPENTLRAFKKALELGADGIEFDVQRTKDGKFVVIHDETVDRTTNGAGRVKDFTLKEIKKLDAGRGERIPTLEEVLDSIEEKITFEIELKAPNVEREIIEIIEDRNLQNRTLFFSPWHVVSRKIKQFNNRLKTGITFYVFPIDIEKVIKHLDFDIIHLDYRHINKDVVETLHKNKKEVAVWTVNRLSDLQRMMFFNVDEIVTDFPDVVLTEVKTKDWFKKKLTPK